MDWAERQGRRWAFTLSNAGSRYFQDRCDLAQLDEIDREAVRARNWQNRAGRDVRPRIEEALGGFDNLDVVVFEPSGAPAPERMARGHEVPKMTSGRAALIGLMDRYLNGLLDPFVTVLEVHKLMYFMQAAGERLKLRYVKGLYGPYAENLRHVLGAVEGHFVSGYADGGDRPDKLLELLPGAAESAAEVLRRSHRARERFDRVTDLVDGFESAFGLELLSTVHWVLAHDAPALRDDLVAHTYAWNERKRRFSPRQINLAADVLTDKGWTGHTLPAGPP